MIWWLSLWGANEDFVCHCTAWILQEGFPIGCLSGWSGVCEGGFRERFGRNLWSLHTIDDLVIVFARCKRGFCLSLNCSNTTRRVSNWLAWWLVGWFGVWSRFGRNLWSPHKMDDLVIVCLRCKRGFCLSPDCPNTTRSFCFHLFSYNSVCSSGRSPWYTAERCRFSSK